jgi:hypothetical protein
VAQKKVGLIRRARLAGDQPSDLKIWEDLKATSTIGQALLEIP